MKHVLFKIRPGKESAWKAWGDYLHQQETQVVKTLKQENCVYERSVIFVCGGETFMVGSMEFDGQPEQANMSAALNIEHKRVKGECLQALAKFEGEYHLPTQYEIVYEFDTRSAS
ncbi:MAG TPA: DUF6176 family protein [Candidatus Paceibacterota bacterium]|nr:DUF6176 family protein [Candidatus Paceibacterota bacterium]